MVKIFLATSLVVITPIFATMIKLLKFLKLVYNFIPESEREENHMQAERERESERDRERERKERKMVFIALSKKDKKKKSRTGSQIEQKRQEHEFCHPSNWKANYVFTREKGEILDKKRSV